MKITRRTLLLLAGLAPALYLATTEPTYEPLPVRIVSLYRVRFEREGRDREFWTAHYLLETTNGMHEVCTAHRETLERVYLTICFAHRCQSVHDLMELWRSDDWRSKGEVIEENREELERLYGPAPKTVEEFRAKMGPDYNAFEDYLLDRTGTA
jgi:hypothetical protein